MKHQVIFKTEEGQKAILGGYDSVLNQWPVPFETIVLPTSFGKTHIIVSGEKSAPPLFLLHGTSSNSAMWVGDVAEFSRHYRVYAVDIPGEPGKSEAIRHELTSAAHANWILEILNTLQIEKASFVGISLGGWMTLQFATRNPDRIAKLVLLCPSGISPQKMSFMFKVIPLLFFGKWGMKKVSRLVNGDQPIPDEALQYTILIANHFNPRVVMVPIFKDEELQSLTMPVLLIVGAKDVLLHSKKSATRLQYLLPHAKVMLKSEAGHVLINLTNEILEFLNSNVP